MWLNCWRCGDTFHQFSVYWRRAHVTSLRWSRDLGDVVFNGRKHSRFDLETEWSIWNDILKIGRYSLMLCIKSDANRYLNFIDIAVWSQFWRLVCRRLCVGASNEIRLREEPLVGVLKSSAAVEEERRVVDSYVVVFAVSTHAVVLIDRTLNRSPSSQSFLRSARWVQWLWVTLTVTEC